MLHQAVATNNEAVYLLDSGNLAEAVCAFQRAVAIMKVAASSSVPPPPPSGIRSQPHRKNGSVKADSLFGFHHSSALPGLQYGHAFVYDRPLLIPQAAASVNLARASPSQVDSMVTVTSTILMFNFAMACHHIGKITGQDAPLQHAYQLYGLVLQCLQCNNNNDDEAHHHHPDESITLVLQCLALNNLAQLQYCEYSEFEKSRTCLAELLRTASKCACCFDLYLAPDQVEELMLNLIHLDPPTAASAA